MNLLNLHLMWGFFCTSIFLKPAKNHILSKQLFKVCLINYSMLSFTMYIEYQLVLSSLFCKCIQIKVNKFDILAYF